MDAADIDQDAVYAARPGLQTYCAFTGGDAPVDNNPPGVSDIQVTTGSAAGAKRDTAASTPCKANILIFVKGKHTEAQQNFDRSYSHKPRDIRAGRCWCDCWTLHTELFEQRPRHFI